MIDLTRFPFHAVMMESQIMSDGVSKICRQNVRLVHVDVHRDADGFSRANRSDSRDCWPAVLKGLPAKSSYRFLITTKVELLNRKDCFWNFGPWNIDWNVMLYASNSYNKYTNGNSSNLQ